LIAGGMNGSKVLQVRGLADAIPLYPKDPENPANRRITILVLNKQAEDTFRRDGATASVDVKAGSPIVLPSPADGTDAAAADDSGSPAP
jgi:chemotaxis protein MotB